MSQAGPLGLINGSMNGSLKEVQALLAAGAYKEAKDEVGGLCGGHMKEERAGRQGLCAYMNEGDENIQAFYVSHSVA